VGYFHRDHIYKIESLPYITADIQTYMLFQRKSAKKPGGSTFRPSCPLGWVDIGTGTKVPLKFVTYLSKVTKINEKSVLTQ
jgi:hypothetical protein